MPAPTPEQSIRVWTDGSCLQNPGGPGGWAFLVRWPNGDECHSIGHEPNTTNNRMEIMAALRSLEWLKEHGYQGRYVWIYTDSRLLVNTMTAGWKRKSNTDLWQRMDQAVARVPAIWTWVRGHNGHKENERVDQLARRAAREGRAECLGYS